MTSSSWVQLKEHSLVSASLGLQTGECLQCSCLQLILAAGSKAGSLTIGSLDPAWQRSSSPSSCPHHALSRRWSSSAIGVCYLTQPRRKLTLRAPGVLAGVPSRTPLGASSDHPLEHFWSAPRFFLDPPLDHPVPLV